jgi:CRP-like cAMP-binding protein
VVALVLGLGMQDQLHNLFAGISIHFTRPFKVGDWLLIDGHHARVTEISWRDTRLLTTDEMMIEVGNAEISKQIITNFEEPTPRHALRATIGLHYNVPPARAQAVLKEAAASVPGVCAEPAPVVYVKDFADSAVVYEIKVWIDDHALTSRVLSDVRSHAWYAVTRAGMEIPYPQLTIHRARPVDGAFAARRAATAALQAHPIFGFLPPDQLESVVNESRVQLFAPSERLIEQGAQGASLFALVHGQVEVHLRHDGISKVVAKLGPGDCVGEMSLLAGEPRTASVVAVNEVEAIEITKPTFATLLRNNPHVIERLGELLAKRQMANAQHAATANGATVEQVRRGMVARLQAFFALG